MAKTKSLNSDDTVYVTTFFGGENKGRSYAITVNIDGSQVQTILREAELFELLRTTDSAIVQADLGVRPVFDG